MSVHCITVKGPAIRVALIGAYLARRWLSPGRRLVLAPDEADAHSPALAVRPDHFRFHAELGVPLETLIKEAGAELLFAPSYQGASGPVRLPFLPIGGSISGVEFQHYWLRANRIEPQPDLVSFSQAIALEEADYRYAWDRLGKGAGGFGLTLKTQNYAAILLNLAGQLGAVTTPRAERPEDGALVFDCSGTARPSWSGSVVTLYDAPPLPGIEWQVSVNAARRFVDLSASSPHSENEQREYTRLTQAEAQRITDMQELLEAADPRACTIPTLRRKVDVFEACGRIPGEDFEVFTQVEWLAALWRSGLRPHRYDRMADLMPEEQLMSMIAQYKGQAAALTRTKENA